MPGIRPFAEDDIPQVADLLWRYLHGRQGASNPGLRVYLKELFFQNPWLDDGIVSRVHEGSDGQIAAFYGAVPRRMTLQGRSIRLAFGSNFVVDPNSRTSMAALQLVRAFMKGPQHVSITDSATDSARQLLRSVGFNVVPVYSLHWARPLRVSMYALHAIWRLKKCRTLAALGALSRPFCAAADALAARVPLSPFRQTPPACTEEDLGIETLLECLATIPGKHLLLPEYDRTSLAWVLDFVSRRKAFGDVRQVLLRDGTRKIIGWYIYYVAPGGIGEVVQIGARTASVAAVLDHLFYDAWQHGLHGIHGRLEPQFLDDLSRKACVFFRSGSWTLVHSNNAELVALLQGGMAFFSRLDGEWCLRPGTELS